ncbi:hypothetical protein RQV73_001680 [Vibrio fluvialis]|nr:hypothetical protein [Vibrio fluvialis]
MKNKLALAIALMLPFSAMAAQTSVDEVKEKFEMSHIYPVDWNQTEHGYEAESSDDNRYIKVKLSETSAMAKIEFEGSESDFAIYAVVNCDRLSDLIPMERSSSWSDEQTEDEKLLSSVITEDIKVGQTKKATINNWDVSFTRTSDGAHCEVSKR